MNAMMADGFKFSIVYLYSFYFHAYFYSIDDGGCDLDLEDDELETVLEKIASTLDPGSSLPNAFENLGSSLNLMDTIRSILCSEYGDGTQLYFNPCHYFIL
jgi:hypothetical protein